MYFKIDSFDVLVGSWRFLLLAVCDWDCFFFFSILHCEIVFLNFNNILASLGVPELCSLVLWIQKVYVSLGSLHCDPMRNDRTFPDRR